MRVLELFSGIGGCAVAIGDRAQVVAAVDQNEAARTVYGRRFDHPQHNLNLHHAKMDWFAGFEADLWWMSPPCQPYTIRGARRDLDDPRSQALKRVVRAIGEVQPAHVALENVPWFEGSAGEALILGVLGELGYEVHSQVLCATELGVPSQRRRYYLVASKQGLTKPADRAPHDGLLRDLLDQQPAAETRVEDALLARYPYALHIVDYDDDDAISACFTGAYGKSPVYAGSYLRQNGRVRRFSPAEIGRTLGLGALEFPAGLNLRTRYKLVGNSLSVPAVRQVLSRLPGL